MMCWKALKSIRLSMACGIAVLLCGPAGATMGLLGRCDFSINQVSLSPEDIQFYSDWPSPPSWITYQGEPISSHEASRHFWLFIQLGSESPAEALTMALELRWTLEAMAAHAEENEMRIRLIEDALWNFSQDVSAKGKYLELHVVYQTQTPNPNPVADFERAYPGGIYFYLLVIYNLDLCGATDIIWSDFTVPTFLSQFLAIPGPAQVVLEWTTESESDHLGFNLLRRGSSDENFQIINERLIAAVPGSPAPGRKQYSYRDRAVEAGATYEYLLESVDFQGQRTVCGMAVATTAAADAVLPEVFRLSQNYPNPFNASTKIRYLLGASAHVTMRIFDVRGQVIAVLADEDQQEGQHVLHWNGLTADSRPAGSGLYFCSLQALGHQEVIKMVLLR